MLMMMMMMMYFPFLYLSVCSNYSLGSKIFKSSQDTNGRSLLSKIDNFLTQYNIPQTRLLGYHGAVFF